MTDAHETNPLARASFPFSSVCERSVRPGG
jgi:hypothetical protein